MIATVSRRLEALTEGQSMEVPLIKKRWATRSASLFATLAVALLSVSAWAYPFPNTDLRSLDVDKTHTGSDADGEFTGIPAKESDACWLCSAASVVGTARNWTQAQAQTQYSSWLTTYSGAVPTRNGSQIASFINAYFNTMGIEYAATWYQVEAYGPLATKATAKAMFRDMIEQALDGESIIMSLLRVKGTDVMGHTTVLDGWVGLSGEDVTTGIVSVVDSQGDYIDQTLGKALDYTLLVKNIEEQTFTLPSGAVINGWFPTLTYSNAAGAKVFTDYIVGFVSTSPVPLPASWTLFVIGTLAMIRRKQRLRLAKLPTPQPTTRT